MKGFSHHVCPSQQVLDFAQQVLCKTTYPLLCNPPLCTVDLAFINDHHNQCHPSLSPLITLKTNKKNFYGGGDEEPFRGSFIHGSMLCVGEGLRIGHPVFIGDVSVNRR